MARAAAAALGLDLAASWVVGDRPEDVGLAEATGASAIYLGPGPRGATGMVVPEPGRRGPVHLGARCRMTSVFDPATSVPPMGSQSKFPSVPYTVASAYFEDYSDEMVQAWKSLDFAELDRAAVILSDAYARRAAVFSCGNGGSASIANHLVCDHTKGIRTKSDLVRGC